MAPQHQEAKASRRRPLWDVVTGATCHPHLLVGVKALFLQMPEIPVASSLALSALFRIAWAGGSCLHPQSQPLPEAPCIQ